MKKSLLIGLATTAVTIGVAGITGLSSAATSNMNNTNLVDKIATKFNLNKTEVQAVFDAQHAEHQAEREAEVKTKLDAAVKAGTITQAQADQLIAKQKEMHTFMETLKDKTVEERREAMKTKREEFKKWLTDNNIPESVMMNVRGGGMGHGGPGRHGGPEGAEENSETSKSTN